MSSTWRWPVIEKTAPMKASGFCIFELIGHDCMLRSASAVLRPNVGPKSCNQEELNPAVRDCGPLRSKKAQQGLRALGP